MCADKAAKPVVALRSGGELDAMSKNEKIKNISEGLFYVLEKDGSRHTFGSELQAMEAGGQDALTKEARELSKFHGVYQQTNRTDKSEHYAMVRIKCPAGGDLSAQQWGALNDACEKFGDGSLRMTSRQAIQYHHVYGNKLRHLIAYLREHYRDDATLAGCGDVNRNTMAAPLDGLDAEFSPRAHDLANDIADELAPTCSSYSQIWTSEDKLDETAHTPEGDLYGPLYLPRKFKVGVSHPNDNSIDLFTQDVGLMPVVVDGQCDGELWDLYTGGGLGFKHGKAKTQPLLGMFLGRMTRDQVVPAICGIVRLQRDFGERKDRQQARWKYTIRRLGMDHVRDALRDEFGIAFEVVSNPQAIPNATGLEGWHDCADGTSAYGLSIPSGRLKDEMRKGVREAVESLGLTVRLTTQEDLLLCGVKDRDALLKILNQHEVPLSESLSLVRRHAMACPALPTCVLAMTEAERALPVYCDAIEAAGFGDVDAEIRITGCPNNCARAVSSEIGVYGFGKNAHVVVVGGAKNGSRLGVPLYDKVPSEKMEDVLIGLLRVVKERCADGQSTGDFLHEAGPEQLRNWLGIDL